MYLQTLDNTGSSQFLIRLAVTADVGSALGSLRVLPITAIYLMNQHYCVVMLSGALRYIQMKLVLGSTAEFYRKPTLVQVCFLPVRIKVVCGQLLQLISEK